MSCANMQSYEEIVALYLSTDECKSYEEDFKKKLKNNVLFLKEGILLHLITNLKNLEQIKASASGFFISNEFLDCLTYVAFCTPSSIILDKDCIFNFNSCKSFLKVYKPLQCTFFQNETLNIDVTIINSLEKLKLQSTLFNSEFLARYYVKSAEKNSTLIKKFKSTIENYHKFFAIQYMYDILQTSNPNIFNEDSTFGYTENDVKALLSKINTIKNDTKNVPSFETPTSADRKDIPGILFEHNFKYWNNDTTNNYFKYFDIVRNFNLLHKLELNYKIQELLQGHYIHKQIILFKCADDNIQFFTSRSIYDKLQVYYQQNKDYTVTLLNNLNETNTDNGDDKESDKDDDSDSSDQDDNNEDNSKGVIDKINNNKFFDAMESFNFVHVKMTGKNNDTKSPITVIKAYEEIISELINYFKLELFNSNEP